MSMCLCVPPLFLKLCVIETSDKYCVLKKEKQASKKASLASWYWLTHWHLSVNVCKDMGFAHIPSVNSNVVKTNILENLTIFFVSLLKHFQPSQQF